MQVGRLFGVATASTFLLAMATLIWFSVGAPLQDWRMNRISARDATIEETRKLHRSIARLTAEQSSFGDAGPSEVLWQAEQTGLAIALIQSEMSQIAGEWNVQLRSISPTRQRDLDLVTVIGIRIEMEAALDQLTGFLREIEYHSPPLLVERATLRRINKSEARKNLPLVYAQIDFFAPVVLQAKALQ